MFIIYILLTAQTLLLVRIIKLLHGQPTIDTQKEDNPGVTQFLEPKSKEEKFKEALTIDDLLK